ncbi:helix-turn-helix domain-containing protein [Arthrobacter sp. ZBG10]|uniref:helix-turn-helix domain-containing protein n=1 Tax=Arthrobacter sp. ZBG10 TaxID=1676590 RepID=UPI002F40086D
MFVAPDMAGLRSTVGLRRVPGLSREELAMLAGMSVDYYNRLERGNLTGVSDSILGSLARALYHPNGDEPEQPQNFARFLFLDPAAPGQVVDWEPMAQDIVAILRQEAARDPHNRDLTDLIGELSTQSEDFRSMWAAQNVRLHRSGTKSFHHPVVGDFELTFQAMQLPGDEGLTLIAYSAAPGSTGHDTLNLLATWAATMRRERNEVGELPARPGTI